MARLKLVIVLFALATALPMAYVVARTYRGVAQEETARMRFFAETLFDAIEAALAERVEIEENRPVDAYHDTLPAGGATAPFIAGYLQNNPDGTFQALPTPVGPEGGPAAVRELEEVNRLFNRKKHAIPPLRLSPPSTPAAGADSPAAPEEEKSSFAGKFLDVRRKRAPDDYLGRKSQRTEAITAEQALNLARRDEVGPDPQTGKAETADRARGASSSPPPRTEGRLLAEADAAAPEALRPARFQAEVDPLQSVFIDADRIFIFRRIVIDERIYRQGFVLRVEEFLGHLAATFFTHQPMARFTRLQLEVAGPDHRPAVHRAGATVTQERFALERRFPVPFDFLQARLTCENIPPAAARQTLHIMLGVLAAVFTLGLLAIYRSVQAMVDLSERRARFVSSVTHELKTPLTNIRLYIEMLEQGIARDTAREQDYLRVVGAESARLTRLITNVLELSRLEKKQRHLNLEKGNLAEVFADVQTVMGEKLHQERFHLTIGTAPTALECVYDREVMVQVLINLIENSIKFGRHAATRQIAIAIADTGDGVAVSVADTGPGIPRQALKRIFDDFYRVEDPLTRSTNGTGIGLSLVRRFMQAMGGRVKAVNNEGPGCTIVLHLPKA